MVWLLSVIFIYFELLGLGIDEDICVMFEWDGFVKVIG